MTQTSNTCECGQPAAEVCFKAGHGEIWFCTARQHTPEIRQLAKQGWMSQAPAIAASKMGIMIRQRALAA